MYFVFAMNRSTCCYCDLFTSIAMGGCCHLINPILRKWSPLLWSAIATLSVVPPLPKTHIWTSAGPRSQKLLFIPTLRYISSQSARVIKFTWKYVWQISSDQLVCWLSALLVKWICSCHARSSFGDKNFGARACSSGSGSFDPSWVPLGVEIQMMI